MKKRSNNTALSHVRLPVGGQLIVLFCVSGSGDFGGLKHAGAEWPSAARLAIRRAPWTPHREGGSMLIRPACDWSGPAARQRACVMIL